jgi:hypothetical protein
MAVAGLEMAVRKVRGWYKMAASLQGCKPGRRVVSTGEDTADWEKLVHAVVNCRVCELVRVQQLLAVMICKCSINPTTNPNPIYSHSYTWQYYKKFYTQDGFKLVHNTFLACTRVQVFCFLSYCILTAHLDPVMLTYILPSPSITCVPTFHFLQQLLGELG